MPQAFGAIEGYQPQAGRFFTAATDSALLVSPSMARRLGFDDPATAVGDSLTLTTASLDLATLQAAALSFGQGLGTLPLKERDYRLQIAGLLKEENQTVSGFTRVVLPLQRAQTMQKVTLFSTLDLLLRKGPAEGYPALRVQLAEADREAAVRRGIEALGIYAMSFRDQFQQFGASFSSWTSRLPSSASSRSSSPLWTSPTR